MLSVISFLCRFSNCLFALTLFIFFPPSAVHAQVPDAPIILEFSSGSCVVQPEVCGDSIDQDCDGSDLLCTTATGDPIAGSGADADFDGYRQSADCDDTNRKVYPGISVNCSASCGSGTKTCQANGSFSACSCAPLCEATGSGKCYYISKTTGSDSNPGTFNAPWESLKPINNTSNNSPVSATLQAGDVVYLMSGIYNQATVYGQFTSVLSLSGIKGTAQNPIMIKAYPGASPTIAPNVQAYGGLLFGVEHIILEGIEVTGAWQKGLWFADSCNDIELRNMWVHVIDGVDNDNISGLMFNETVNLRIHHSVINDNYDRTNSDTNGLRTENSRNIVMFRGGNVEIDYNTIFNTPVYTAAKTGACLGYKHPSETSGQFEVHHNTFRNCFHAAVQSYTTNGFFHHNIITNSERGFYVKGHGTILNLTDYLIEHNTFIETRALEYDPSDALEYGGLAGPMTFRKNIAVFSGPYNNDLGGIVTIDAYGLNTYYSAVANTNHLRFSQNCYYNPSGYVRIGLFNANDNPSDSLGSLSTISAWQSLGYGAGSIDSNPQLDTFLVPQNAQCQSMGIYSQ